jgi:hypothetical protein
LARKLDEGQHRQIVTRLIEPTLWAAGLAREADEHGCK